MWYPSIVTGVTNCFNCHVILLSTQSIQAFTCYSPPELNFRMYYIPFENSVWICLVWNGVLLCFLLGVYIKFYKLEVAGFSFILLYISSLTEEPLSLPKKLNKVFWIRAIVVLWLFYHVSLH